MNWLTVNQIEDLAFRYEGYLANFYLKKYGFIIIQEALIPIHLALRCATMICHSEARFYVGMKIRDKHWRKLKTESNLNLNLGKQNPQAVVKTILNRAKAFEMQDYCSVISSIEVQGPHVLMFMAKDKSDPLNLVHTEPLYTRSFPHLGGSDLEHVVKSWNFCRKSVV